MKNLLAINWYEDRFAELLKKEDLIDAAKLYKKISENQEYLYDALEVVLTESGGKDFVSRNTVAAILIYSPGDSPEFLRAKEALLESFILSSHEIELKGAYQNMLEVLLMREDIKFNSYEKYRIKLLRLAIEEKKRRRI